jgi:hypothetical protein
MNDIARIACIFALLLMAASGAPGQVYILGELAQEKTALPGEAYEGSIVIRNDATEPAEARIYQTGYSFSCDGRTTYGPPDSQQRSNASWITFKPTRMVVPAKGSTTVAYTVAVPRDSGGKPLQGTYWSMLMVEGIGKESPESSVPGADKRPHLGIQQVIRYGLQIATHIANTGSKSVRFLEANVVPGKSGKPSLQFDLENSGDLGIRPEVSVEIFDAKGTSRGKYTGTRYRIYPGTSVHEVIEFPAPPAGEYKALVLVDAGDDDVFGAQYTLKF